MTRCMNNCVLVKYLAVYEIHTQNTDNKIRKIRLHTDAISMPGNLGKNDNTVTILKTYCRVRPTYCDYVHGVT